MELNIQKAADFIKISRSTLYNKMQSGELSKTPTGKLETSELLRVFGRPEDRDKVRQKTQLDSIKNTIKTNNYWEVDALKEQIKILKEALEEARKRESWLMAKLDTLADTVKLLEDGKEKKWFFSRLFS